MVPVSYTHLDVYKRQQPYIIVDTGGLSGATDGVESLMERQVAVAIQEADQLLFMVDAREGCSGHDLDIAERLRRTCLLYTSRCV